MSQCLPCRLQLIAQGFQVTRCYKLLPTLNSLVLGKLREYDRFSEVPRRLGKLSAILQAIHLINLDELQGPYCDLTAMMVTQENCPKNSQTCQFGEMLSLLLTFEIYPDD